MKKGITNIEIYNSIYSNYMYMGALTIGC